MILQSSTLFGVENAWKAFHVKSERKCITSYLYAASLFGEGSLQYLAWKNPEKYMDSAILYMLPYKIISVSSMAWLSLTSSEPIKTEALAVALQWSAPIILIALVSRGHFSLT